MLKTFFNKLMGKSNSGEIAPPVPQPQQPIIQSQPVIQNATPKIVPPPLDVFKFNIAGVTAKNDQKKDIQKLLQQQARLYAKEYAIELYGGFKNKEIIEDGLEVSEFEDLLFTKHEITFVPEPENQYDSNAIKVFIEFNKDDKMVHIGYVPKVNNIELKRILDDEDVRRIEGRFVGGKIKKVDYDDEKDKDVVVIDELTLGFEIRVFYLKK